MALCQSLLNYNIDSFSLSLCNIFLWGSDCYKSLKNIHIKAVPLVWVPSLALAKRDEEKIKVDQENEKKKSHLFLGLMKYFKNRHWT